MSPSNAVPFISSIVHPTDFSAASERAFAHALALALLRRTSLKLLHVTSDPHRDWSAFPAVRATLERWGLLKHGSSQEQVFGELGVRIGKLAISSYFPALAVVEYLDDHPTDLLVVATEGREGVARWLHGSVAEAMAQVDENDDVIRACRCRARNRVAGRRPSDAQQRADSGRSFTPNPSAAIEFARRAAEILGEGNVTITLLHVGAEADMPQVRAEDGTGWRFERVRREGDPVEEIVQAADQSTPSSS